MLYVWDGDGPAIHDCVESNGGDGPATHDCAESNGGDGPATHGCAESKGGDCPATHDCGDNGLGTHCCGDGHHVESNGHEWSRKHHIHFQNEDME